MLLGCIADDFTGASDLANTLARHGMRTIQFSGVPAGNDAPDCEAAVVALKTRSIPAGEAVAHSLVALEWLKRKGCRQFLFKYCSTFDSTPEGNIGPVAEALLDALGASSAVVCPAFPATGRTLYMGHLFVGDRLLSESGMQNHPLNPMTDPDIRRWLRRQTKTKVGLVAYDKVRQGADTIKATISAEADRGNRLIVVDAVADADLLTIGRAIADHALVTGGSGIALGLPENFRSRGLLRDAGSGFSPIRGKAAVISGSCSTASLAQVKAYLESHPGLAVDGGDVLSGKMTPQSAIAFFRDHSNEAPIIYSTADPEKVKSSQEKYGREKLAHAIEAFFSDVAIGLAHEGVLRLAVGGGETSGAVVTALKVPHMFIGPEIDPGVPAMAAGGNPPVRLALKSGNFGTTDFYEKALKMLETP